MSTYFEPLFSRRKAAERLAEQCRKQREEAVGLLRKFDALFEGCRHPQLLPRSVVESYQAAVERVRTIDKKLHIQEHSRAPDQAQVRDNEYCNKLLPRFFHMCIGQGTSAITLNQPYPADSGVVFMF